MTQKQFRTSLLLKKREKSPHYGQVKHKTSMNSQRVRCTCDLRSTVMTLSTPTKENAVSTQSPSLKNTQVRNNRTGHYCESKSRKVPFEILAEIMDIPCSV